MLTSSERRVREGLSFAAAIGVGSSLARKALSLVYSIAFVRAVGPESYGVFVAFETVVRPLGIISAVGGQHLVVKEVVAARTGGHGDGTPGSVIAAKLILTLAVGALAALATVALAGVLHRALGGLPGLQGLLTYWSWWAIPLGLVTIVGGVLVAHGRSSVMFLLTNIVDPLARLALLPVLWGLLHVVDAPWKVVALPEAVAAVLIVAIGFWAMRSDVPTHALDIASGIKDVPRVAAAGFPLLAHALATIAFAYTDRVMVSAMLGDAFALGAYNITLVLAGFLILFHRSLVTVVSPRISEAIAQDDSSEVQRLYRQSAEASFLLAAVGYTLFLLFGSDILGLYDSAYRPYAVLLAVVAWGQLVDTFAGCGDYILIAKGKGHYLMWNSFITIACNIGMNWILISRFGLLGAAIATAASYVLKNGLIVAENVILDRLHPFTLVHVLALCLTLFGGLVVFALRVPDMSFAVRLASACCVGVLVVVALGRGSGGLRRTVWGRAWR